MAIKGVRKSKNPPILSHEFFIQNHADIVSCVAMVFVLGLMFQATSPLAAIFVTLSHNATAFEDLTQEAPHMLYTNGLKDIAAVFFYTLICVVIHAVIQEYIIDKITRKMHLSKTKHSKFNESGQLFVFSALCSAWGINIIFKDNVLTEISSLWIGYPKEHSEMTFMLKFFFIVQLSYWLHCFPELYFQKVKKEDMAKKIQYASLFFVFSAAAYIMNFTHVGLVLLVLRFIDESVLHLCRLLHFAEKMKPASTGFGVWNILFVGCRLISFIVTILTFHYGLATLSNQEFNVAIGNFNTPFIRFNALVGVCLIQAWMMWNFIHFHLRRSREKQALAPKKKAPEPKTKGKKYKKDDSKRHGEDDVSMLPEADQNSRRRK
ncbi:UNVERIFIED_CONTAM: hypothetical protein RMT77_017266 [Armadillidium vulgare]